MSHKRDEDERMRPVQKGWGVVDRKVLGGKVEKSDVQRGLGGAFAGIRLGDWACPTVTRDHLEPSAILVACW